MIARNILKKIILILVVIMSFSSATVYAYSYWDNLNQADSGKTLNIGNWGTPISTAQEFYDLATNPNSLATDNYYLINDIDFTGFNWTLDATNSTVVFRGTIDGFGHTISNLKVYSDDVFYSSIGIFPYLEGGYISNLIFDNVDIELGANALGRNNFSAGIIAGTINSGTNTLDKITVANSTVMGTSTSGAGGLIGAVTGAATVLNISDVKASNLKVFNTNSNVGGIIGGINDSGAQVTINDLDMQGEVFSASSSSYAGGVVGNVANGSIFNISRAIVETTLQNTFVTDPIYYLHYSQKYSGGIIGNNQNTSGNVSIINSFFTGSLYTDDKKSYYYIGTAIGRSKSAPAITNSYYSQVIFRDSGGNQTFTVPSNANGVFLTLVNASTMPDLTWWNNFALNYDLINIWSQNTNSGRLFINR